MRILSLFALLFFCSTIQGQDLPQSDAVKKAGMLMEKGQFKKSLATYNKSLRKIEKELGSDDEWYQKVLVKRARTLDPIGRIRQFHKAQVIQALYRLDSTYAKGSKESCEALYDAIKFFNDIGHYSNSVPLEKQFFDHFKPKSEKDSILFFDVHLETLRRDMGLGNYSKLSNSLPPMVQALESRIKDADFIFNPLTEEIENRKLKGSEKDAREKQFLTAKLIFYKLQFQIEEDRLDSLSKSAYSWFKDNGGKNQRGFMGELARYIGDGYYSVAEYSKAKSWYKTAANHFKKDYHKGHPEALDLQARLIDVHIAKDDEKQVEIAFNKLKRLTSYYPKEYRDVQPAFLHGAINTYEYKRIFTNALYQAGLWRKYVHDNDFLPTLSAFQANKDVYNFLLERRRTALAGEFVEMNRTWSNELFGPSLNHSSNNMIWADYQMTYLMDLKNAKSIYFGEDWNTILNEVGTKHSLSRKGMENRGKLFVLDNKFDEAEGAFSTTVESYDQNTTQSQISKALIIGELSKLYLTKGDYQKAIDTLMYAQGLVEEVVGKKSYEYAQLMQVEAQYYEFMGDIDHSNDLIRKSTNQMNEMLRKQKVKMKADGENLALMFLYSGQYKQADKLLEQLVLNRESEFGNDSPTLIKPLYYWSKSNLLAGDFVKAEKLTRNAMQLSNENNGTQTLEYLMLQKQLAEVYFQIGDYYNSVAILEEVAAVQKSILGKNHLSLASTYTQLSKAMYFNDGEVKPAKRMAVSAQKIIEKAVGKNHPFYASALLNEAMLEMEDERFPKADGLLNQAERIVEEKFGSKSIQMARIHHLRGDMALMRGKKEQSLVSLHEAGKIFRKNFSKSHPKYLKVQTKIARAELMDGQTDRALARMEDVLEEDLIFVENYFGHLSEREKAKYWRQLKEDFDVYYFAFFSKPDVKQAEIEQALDYRIRTKGLLFNSNLAIQRKVKNGGDTILVAMYEDWQRRKELMASIISLSEEELDDRGYNLFRMEREINELEKEISEETGIPFGGEQVSADDIQSQLAADEMSVEVIRYSSPYVFGVDTAYYGYITTSSDAFQRVKNPTSGIEIEQDFTNYYRNAVRLSAEDLYSYEALWKPIHEVAEGKSKIYFSPDGTYNQINPEMFTLPDGQFVFDQYEVNLLGNIADFVGQKEELKMDSAVSLSIELVGNPLFYDEDMTGPKLITNLPGAEVEVQTINTFLTEKGWKTHALLGADGGEEEVKKMKRPDVVHFATHGYFTEQKMASSGVGIKDLRAIRNPLFLSGLILKDGGPLIEGDPLYINQRNGVLTAYEAMNLDLEKTQLVVLSACETGLGKIEQGEGVYGLQRALMNAGAETVIMSLFKVSDEVTQELMVIFYDEWIKGATKKEAFRSAKRQIREKYPDPKLWGSFIMVSSKP